MVPVDTLIAESVQFRRPNVPGAVDIAQPGGEDYKSNPLPSKNFDCQPLAKLMPQMDWKAIHACMTSGVTKSTTIYFQLKRNTQPILDLDASDQENLPPECFLNLLREIPVPREIFYVSMDTGQPACYSSNFDMEADKFFDTKMPSGEYGMVVNLPLRYPPKDADEARRIVQSWSITPLWNHEERRFNAHVFPDALCKRCMGEKALNPPQHMQVLTSWPPR